jgi:hypothetical protein
MDVLAKMVRISYLLNGQKFKIVLNVRL